MKRFTLSVVITAVLGLTAYSLADAGSARLGFHRFEDAGTGFFQERGPGGPRGRGPGRGGPMMFGLRDIDLTDEQRAQIRAIHEEERQAQQGPPADLQLHRQLQSALFADAADPQKIAELQQQLLQAQAARLALRIAIELKVANVLTAEQRAQVRERLERGPGQRSNRTDVQ